MKNYSSNNYAQHCFNHKWTLNQIHQLLTAFVWLPAVFDSFATSIFKASSWLRIDSCFFSSCFSSFKSSWRIKNTFTLFLINQIIISNLTKYLIFYKNCKSTKSTEKRCFTTFSLTKFCYHSWIFLLGGDIFLWFRFIKISIVSWLCIISLKFALTSIKYLWQRGHLSGLLIWWSWVWIQV